MPLYKIENDLKRDVVKITPGCKPINICIFLKQIGGNKIPIVKSVMMRK